MYVKVIVVEYNSRVPFTVVVKTVVMVVTPPEFVMVVVRVSGGRVKVATVV